jgi:ribosomal protein L32E
MKRKKPKFLMKDWHKKLKLGKKRKKKRKWKAAKGIHNKIRLKKAGHARRPKIGWGSKKSKKKEAIKIENLKQLEDIKKEEKILIAGVGVKKRQEIKEAAEKKGILILNKYRKKNETK